ncbi:hypothetical protein [Streptomyces sp. NPDC086766]|uniref:hypothetical protein n=1 Tax=Streptomyces sp. NPDC086766 TaxID=3365754 RepID=UPI00381F6E71
MDHVVTDDRLMRLRLLQRSVDRIHGDHRVDGDHTERARPMLARRFFGEDLAETFHWMPAPPVTSGSMSATRSRRHCRCTNS